jgi:hypothetical protein
MEAVAHAGEIGLSTRINDQEQMLKHYEAWITACILSAGVSPTETNNVMGLKIGHRF